MITVEELFHEDDYLFIEEVKSSPRLARLLDPSLARKHQAIPVSEERGRITIAMVHPENRRAVYEMNQFIQKPTLFVRAKKTTMEALIAEYYPEPNTFGLDMIAWCPDTGKKREDENYLKYLAEILDARVDWFEPQEKQGAMIYHQMLENIASETPSLLISSFPGNYHSLPFLLQTPQIYLLSRTPINLLSFNKPSWPINKILLILQNYSEDSLALNWAIRFARSSKASITILPLLRPVPKMFTDFQHDLPTILQSSSNLGHHLRRCAEKIVAWDVRGSIKLRNETPDWQLLLEMNEGGYDLVILGYQKMTSLRKLCKLDLFSTVLKQGSIPMLFTQTDSQGKKGE